MAHPSHAPAGAHLSQPPPSNIGFTRADHSASSRTHALESLARAQLSVPVGRAKPSARRVGASRAAAEPRRTISHFNACRTSKDAYLASPIPRLAANNAAVNELTGVADAEIEPAYSCTGHFSLLNEFEKGNRNGLFRRFRWSYPVKPRHGNAIDRDGLEEHGQWPHPEAGVPVKGSVYDQWLIGLAVASGEQHLVAVAFVMPIDARFRCRHGHS
jgi:hypothetical protein